MGIEINTARVTETLKNQANEGRDWSVYKWGLDAAQEAKKAALFPHLEFVRPGAVIVDAGSGTGALATSVALEHREAKVIALDNSHELLDVSSNKPLIELKYGDAAEINFEPGSVDFMYFFTSGHEIESFGGQGRMKQAVESSFVQLKPESGRLIIRDFAKPYGKEPVYLQFIDDNGLSVGEAMKNDVIDYNLLSPSALLERFKQEFHDGKAFDYDVVNIDGINYFVMNPEWAHEFNLRKDYRGNWKNEILEKYTYWTPKESVGILKEAGFVNVKLFPDPNQYILENRLKGKVKLFGFKNGKLNPLNFPMTHMIVRGDKPSESRAFAISESVKTVDYQNLKDSIFIDTEAGIVTISNREFTVLKERPKIGSKKMVFRLSDDPGRVLKTVRKDGANDHNVFKAMLQSINRQEILDVKEIPHCKILEVDPKGPPYRYLIQESVPEGSVSAVDLIINGNLTEEDTKQMAEYVNKFEIEKSLQLDTNPYNWYKVKNEDGSYNMVYTDGKIYIYDEKWEFKKIGLLQWINPKYLSEMEISTASIPTPNEYDELKRNWNNNNEESILWWKKYLHPSLQPSIIK